MEDDTRPPGPSPVPAELLSEVALVIAGGEALMSNAEAFAANARRVLAEAEEHLRGLTDDDHWRAAEAAGLVRLMRLVDRLTGGDGL